MFSVLSKQTLKNGSEIQMYYSRQQSLHRNIDNASLVFCTKIAQKVKEPPYIPFLEVYTYGLVARYFELSESASKTHIIRTDICLKMTVL